MKRQLHRGVACLVLLASSVVILQASEICSGAAGDIKNTTFTSGVVATCTSNSSIGVGPSVAVNAGASVSLFAPTITLKSPFTIAAGASFVAAQENPDMVKAWQTNLSVVEVSALDSQGIVVSWLPVDDGVTPGEQVSYEIHVSESKDFVPDEGTLKHRQTGMQSAQVGQLTPDTLYYVKMLAFDLYGRQTGSDQSRIQMPAVNPVRNSNVTVIDLQPGVLQGVTPTSLQLVAGTPLPGVGSVISDGPNALLRRVTAAATNPDGTIQVQTENVSISQVYDRLQINSSIRLASIPESSASAARAFAVKGGPTLQRSADGARSVNWPNSRLTLTASDTELVTKAPPSLVRGMTEKAVSGSELYSEAAEKTEPGKYIEITAPQAVGIVPGQSGKMNMTVQIHKEGEKNQSGDPILMTICEVTDLEVEAPSDKTAENLVSNSGIIPLSMEAVSDNIGGVTVRNTKAMSQFSFTPQAGHVSDQPYHVRVRAYVDEAGKMCETSFLRKYGISKGWSEVLEFEFDLYVISSPNFPTNEQKTLIYSGGFSVSNTVDFTFNPSIEPDILVDGASLEHARLVAHADAKFIQKLEIAASGAASIDQTKRLFARDFIKVFLAGGVPVVMKGTLSTDVRIQGSVTGAINATETLTMGFDDLAFGYEYSNGSYQQIKNIEPMYQLSLHGDADAEANLKVSLLPDLQVTFYEFATGRLLVEPYLTAGAGIHGQIYRDSDPNGVVLDADYWLTQGVLSGGVDMWLYAALTVWDYTLYSWPEGADTSQYETFHKVPIIAETPILSLPALSAQQLAGKHPANSRAILFEGRHQDVANPFHTQFGVGPEAFLYFQNWTKPKIVAVNDTGYQLLDQFGIYNERFWIDFNQPGTYRVRLGGHSNMGSWARQVADEIVITRTDNDADDMLDEWETEHSVSDPNGDPDGDGLTNRQEFEQGKDPNRSDADSTGEFIYQWTTGAYGACEGECGGNTGYRQRGVWCETVHGQNPTLDFYCDASTKPSSQQACITDLCLVDPAPTGTLNDTGITTCSDAGSNGLACPQVLYPGQDAEFGRDATHNDDSDGHAGFNFTKLDANGIALPASASNWSCVKDNVTGLIWEVKTDDGGLRDKDWTYTWYNTDSSTNGGSAGTLNGGSCNGSSCDTQGYVQAVNSQGLCGASDWRMPSGTELQGIARLDRTNPVIDTGYFPNTGTSDFWSGSSSAPDSDDAWHVNGGHRYRSNKSDSKYVRLMRSGP